MSNIGKQVIRIPKDSGLSLKVTSYRSGISKNMGEIKKNEINDQSLAELLADSLGARPNLIKKEGLKSKNQQSLRLQRVVLKRGSEQKTLFYPSCYQLQFTESSLRAEEPNWELEISLSSKEYSQEKIWRKYWGSFRANLANAIQGLVEGFTYTLKIKGVGYRANVQNGLLELNLGFSHPVKVEIPAYIQVNIAAGGTEIQVSGNNKEKTSQWVHQVRLIKPSSKDHYKGAGLSLSL